MNDGMIEQLLSQDLSAGTEAFREELLARCLAVLECNDVGMALEDDELEMLAAAGDLFGGEQPLS